jgi:hypothetical protein
MVFYCSFDLVYTMSKKCSKLCKLKSWVWAEPLTATKLKLDGSIEYIYCQLCMKATGREKIYKQVNSAFNVAKHLQAKYSQVCTSFMHHLTCF